MAYPRPTALLSFLQDLIGDLLENFVWLGAHDEVFIGKDERGHACQTVFVRQFNIGGYLRVEGWVCQYVIKVLDVEADLFRYLFQDVCVINRAGLLPVCMHDGFMEDVSFSLRLGILFCNERGPAIDACWPSVNLHPILFSCPFFKHWTRSLYACAVLWRNG